MPAPMYFVVPEGVVDPARVSGGNRYDLELARELGDLFWSVDLRPVTGSWPHPSEADRRKLSRVLESVPEQMPVLLDGLVACGVPDVIEAAARRLRVVVLVHMPLAAEFGLDSEVATELARAEERTLHLAHAVVTTSRWTAELVTEQYGLPGTRVHVAAPGVHLAPVAPGTSSGGRNLLSVGAITPNKGQDVLIEALASLPRDLRWNLKLVGPERDPAYTARLRAIIDDAHLTDRVEFLGPLTGAALDAAYAQADLLVVPAHFESFGMTITEALARGIAVYASDVAGIPEALGHARFPGSTLPERPGRLITPGDSDAWANALSEWMRELVLRDRLRTLAEQRQRTLPTWRSTALEAAGALQGFPSTPWHARSEMAALTE